MGYDATEDFDYVMDTFLQYVPEEKSEEIMLKVFNYYRWQDWDTYEESPYWPKVRAALDRHGELG